MDYVDLRPHHLLCTFNFLGSGYSNKFISNFWNVKKKLEKNTKIRIVSHLDDICKACPNTKGNKCKKEKLIQTLDQEHFLALDLKKRIMTWGDAVYKINSIVTKKVFDNICSSCKWKDYKICEKNLANKVWKANPFEEKLGKF